MGLVFARRESGEAATVSRQYVAGRFAASQMSAVIVPALVSEIETAGYTTPGDGGGGRYKREASEPSHDGKFQDAAGQWFGLLARDGKANLRQFGALGNNTADDESAINAAIVYATTFGVEMIAPKGQYRCTDTISILDADFVYPFILSGASGNDTTEFIFDNAVASKNFIFFGPDVKYITLRDIELVDNTPRTSRGLYFADTTAGSGPNWKNMFERVRVRQFKEGAKFDGGATINDDAHCSEFMFLHSKFRNCETGIVMDNIQAVNLQLIGVDFENDDAGDAAGEWTHIKFTRSSFVNHIGGSVIGHGAYVDFVYGSASQFQASSQFATKGIKIEKRGGDTPIFHQDPASVVNVSNDFKILAEDMAVRWSGTDDKVLAKIGGRAVLALKNVTSNADCVVRGVVSSILEGNGETGHVEMDGCYRVTYERVEAAEYGGSTPSANYIGAIPARIRTARQGKQFQTVDGVDEALAYEQAIYRGGFFEASQIKTLTLAPISALGHGSGSDPWIYDFRVPLHARPFKLRVLRDDVNAGSAFVITLRATVPGLAITGCADNGSGLIRVTTASAHGLTTGNGVTISDVVGTTEANGYWGAVTAIGANTFDLVGSTFSNAYVSGGSYVSHRTAAAITPTSGVGGHFEANLQIATGFTYWLRDDVNWDGEMKLIKSGSTNGFIALIMVDCM